MINIKNAQIITKLAINNVVIVDIRDIPLNTKFIEDNLIIADIGNFTYC